MRRLNRKGQSVLEYVLIISAIVAGIIAIAAGVKGHVQDSVEHATTELKDVVHEKFQ